MDSIWVLCGTIKWVNKVGLVIDKAPEPKPTMGKADSHRVKL